MPAKHAILTFLLNQCTSDLDTSLSYLHQKEPTVIVRLAGTPVRYAGFGHTELDPIRYLYPNARWLDQIFAPASLQVLIDLYATHHLETREEVIAALDAKTIEKTGIRSRFVFVDGTVEELAAQAALSALMHAGLGMADVDAIVVGRNTGTQYASTADHVKRILKIPTHARCFDVQEACTGGLVALDVAAEKISTGRYRCVIAIGADRATQLTPNVVFEKSNLFGDGAAAVVLVPGDQDHPTQHLVSDFESDPHDGKAEWIVRREPDGFDQRGPNVHKEVGRGIPQRLKDFLQACGTEPSEIAACFTHQPSLPTVDLLHAKIRLLMPDFQPRVWPVNVTTHANMSAASTLYVTSHAVRSGQLRPGDLAISISFGASMNDGFVLWRY